MEEFTNTASKDDVILDADKKTVINPIHREDQIVAEQNRTEIANTPANSQTIANISIDVESTTNDVPPEVAQAEQRADELIAAHKANTPPAKPTNFPTYVAAGAVIIGILLFALLYR